MVTGSFQYRIKHYLFYKQVIRNLFRQPLGQPCNIAVLSIYLLSPYVVHKKCTVCECSFANKRHFFILVVQ